MIARKIAILALAIAHLRRPTVVAAGVPGFISGQGFLDPNGDGSRDGDGSLDGGVSGISVYLFTCGDMIVKTAKTDGGGYFAFGNLETGRYYTTVPSVPSGYEFSKMGIDSVVDPDTGKTDCVDLAEGGIVELSFGLTSPTPPPTAPPPTPSPPTTPTPTTPMPTTPPTLLPTTTSTFSPTAKPTEIPSLGATPPPTNGLNSLPTPSPTELSASRPAPAPAAPSPKESTHPMPMVASWPPTLDPKPTDAPAAVTGATDLSENLSPEAAPTFSALMTTAPATAPADALLPRVTTTMRFAMVIRGVGWLEDEEAWAERTAEHVEEYFNSGDAQEAGVWNVGAEILVRRQRPLPPPTGDDCTLPSERLRRHNADSPATAVEISYDQRSVYVTLDPESYDGRYIATRPFEAWDDVERYLATIRGISSHYNGAVNVSWAEVPCSGTSEGDEAAINHIGIERTHTGEQGEGKDRGEVAVIVGVVCAVAVLIVTSVAIIHVRRGFRRSNKEKEGGNLPSSISVRQTYSNLEDGSRRKFSAPSLHTSPASSKQSRLSSSNSSANGVQFNDTAFATLPENSFDAVPLATAITQDSSSSEVIVHIIAPAGLLGVTVDIPPAGGPSYVCGVKETSPIYEKIKINDKIIAVDDEDVQGMSAINVSKLLASRCRNPRRKISVLREADESSDRAVVVDCDVAAEMATKGTVTVGRGVLPPK